MDGYTFMIERNRRLIEHQRELRTRPGRSLPDQQGSRLTEALRRDLRALYHQLEGCGRHTRNDPEP